MFLGTKYYYLEDAEKAAPVQSAQPQSTTNWSEEMSAITPEVLGALVPLNAGVDTAASVAERANAHFSNKQYEAAAKLYEQLIDLDTRNIDAYNNLGITLHYLGRSAEALDWLDAGIQLEAGHQRSWLTIGFIQKELGNVDAASNAFNSALELDVDSVIGNSAAKFLEEIEAAN